MIRSQQKLAISNEIGIGMMVSLVKLDAQQSIVLLIERVSKLFRLTLIKEPTFYLVFPVIFLFISAMFTFCFCPMNVGPKIRPKQSKKFKK